MAARRGSETSQRTEVLAEQVGEAFGARTWVAVYEGDDHRVVVAQPDDQHPGVAARYLADGLRQLTGDDRAGG